MTTVLSDDALNQGAYVLGGILLELCDKVLVDEVSRQLGKKLQVGVAAALRNEDVDDGIDRLAVQRVPLDAGTKARKDDRRCRDVGALCVRSWSAASSPSMTWLESNKAMLASSLDSSL